MIFFSFINFMSSVHVVTCSLSTDVSLLVGVKTGIIQGSELPYRFISLSWQINEPIDLKPETSTSCFLWGTSTFDLTMVLSVASLAQWCGCVFVFVMSKNLFVSDGLVSVIRWYSSTPEQNCIVLQSIVNVDVFIFAQVGD